MLGPMRGAETGPMTNQRPELRSLALEYRWLVNSGSGFTVDILTGSKIFFGRVIA